jgi:BRCT domain type II-containing protein
MKNMTIFQTKPFSSSSRRRCEMTIMNFAATVPMKKMNIFQTKNHFFFFQTQTTIMDFAATVLGPGSVQMGSSA